MNIVSRFYFYRPSIFQGKEDWIYKVLLRSGNAEKDSILIESYDYGIVDNDLASIYLDDSLLLYKQFVSANPISLYVFLDKQKPISKFIE